MVKALIYSKGPPFWMLAYCSQLIILPAANYYDLPPFFRFYKYFLSSRLLMFSPTPFIRDLREHPYLLISIAYRMGIYVYGNLSSLLKYLGRGGANHHKMRGPQRSMSFQRLSFPNLSFLNLNDNRSWEFSEVLLLAFYLEWVYLCI